VISINFYEIIMQMVNFAILLWLLNKFLIKPLLTFLKKREENIKKDISDAKTNKESTETLVEEQKAELLKSRQEARSILQKAESDTKKERQSIMNQTRNEAQRLLENAKKEIDRDFNSSKTELKKYVGELAIGLSEKILKKNLDKDSQNDIIGEYLGSINHK
jgi:F-type H+-transporting ATPase subunit b